MMADLNHEVYGYMWGASEWHVTGTLKHFDARELLSGLALPTLFTCGEHDEARPDTVRGHAALVPGSQVHVFADASHMTSLEQPEAYRRVVGDFLAAHDD